MKIHIELDTYDLSDADLVILEGITSGLNSLPYADGSKGDDVDTEQDVNEAPVETPKEAKKTTDTKKKTEPKAEPVSEPEPEAPSEPAAAGSPTMEDAVALATQLVSNGRAADVKAALASFDTKRVSELKDDAIPQFVALLS